MDTCKIAARRFQYTAVDDCTRYQVLGLFPARKAVFTLQFLERLVEEMPFPIQRVQTDRGREFFATAVQKRLADLGIVGSQPLWTPAERDSRELSPLR